MLLTEVMAKHAGVKDSCEDRAHWHTCYPACSAISLCNVLPVYHIRYVSVTCVVWYLTWNLDRRRSETLQRELLASVHCGSGGPRVPAS